jgi:hypothetical protein
VKLGRLAGKSNYDSHADENAKYLDLGLRKADIARLLRCSRGALVNWLAKCPKKEV